MNKTFLRFTLFTFLFSVGTQAACTYKNFEFSVRVSDRTFDQSYLLGHEEVQMSEEDFAVVKDLTSGEVTRFDIGFFSNDGAGNFGINAISSEAATYINILHDHETWHTGLEGEFSTPEGAIIDLSSVKDCSYDKLFI